MDIDNLNLICHTNESCMVVGRAAAGIYLALLESGLNNGCILVPGNLCYAGIYPAIYAGLTPVFCDVDPFSGNVTLSSVMAAYKTSIRAAVLPHMYGNPIDELPEIFDFLHKRHVLVIEDCASAMGAQSSRYSLGHVGDYIVYSTGYAKTIELGYGGLLKSRVSDLAVASELERQFPLYTESCVRELALFSRVYRLLRNEGHGTAIASAIYAGLLSSSRNSFLVRLSEEQRQSVVQSISTLPTVLRERNRKRNLYARELRGLPLTVPHSSSGAVPWRYNLLIALPQKNRLIADCLSARLPVSDWYPNVTPLFGSPQDLPGTDWHEQHIVNFPLTVEDGLIVHICQFLRSYFEKEAPMLL